MLHVTTRDVCGGGELGQLAQREGYYVKLLAEASPGHHRSSAMQQAPYEFSFALSLTVL